MTGRTCDIPGCQPKNQRDVRAARDPEGNLLDMCKDCRLSWGVGAVEEVEQ